MLFNFKHKNYITSKKCIKIQCIIVFGQIYVAFYSKENLGLIKIAISEELGVVLAQKKKAEPAHLTVTVLPSLAQFSRPDVLLDVVCVAFVSSSRRKHKRYPCDQASEGT